MPTTPEGDTRWTAILSADMAGFTEISQAIGPERVYALLTIVLDHARAAIAAHDGHVVDTAGDGILAAFGAPRALENAALCACRAALDFQDRLQRERQRLESEFDALILFRVGIAGGNTMVARLDDGGIKVVGPAVNTVARLQDLAMPGETLISDAVRQQAEGHVRSADIGHVTLKGFPDPVRVHKLEGAEVAVSSFDAARRRGLVGLVGRGPELRQILSALSDPSDHGVMFLRGPAGIGKSRLAHEASIASGLRVLTGQCQPSSNSRAYQPFSEIFRQAADVAADGDVPDPAAPILMRHPDLRAE